MNKVDRANIINHKIEVWPNMDNETIVDKLHDFVAIWQEQCKEEIKELASANVPFEYGYACGKLDIVEKLEGFLSDTGDY
jgi:hypothetical protein